MLTMNIPMICAGVSTGSVTVALEVLLVLEAIVVGRRHLLSLSALSACPTQCSAEIEPTAV